MKHVQNIVQKSLYTKIRVMEKDYKFICYKTYANYTSHFVCHEPCLKILYKKVYIQKYVYVYVLYKICKIL